MLMIERWKSKTRLNVVQHDNSHQSMVILWTKERKQWSKWTGYRRIWRVVDDEHHTAFQRLRCNLHYVWSLTHAVQGRSWRVTEHSNNQRSRSSISMRETYDDNTRRSTACKARPHPRAKRAPNFGCFERHESSDLKVHKRCRREWICR